MSDFLTTLLYPGVLQIDDPAYAHGVLVAGSELAVPIAAIGQRTAYHFAVAGTSAGTDQGGWSETHHGRAWRMVGWESVRAQGTVVIPNALWYAVTSGGPFPPGDADSPPIGFDQTNTGSIPEKSQAEASAIASPPFAGPPAHTTGLLTTNCNTIETDLGEWSFYGLNKTTFSVVATGTAAVLTVFDPNPPNTAGSNTLYYDIEARVNGNASVIRYDPGGSGDWQYISVFVLELRARLRAGPITSGWMYVNPDGILNPDTGIAGYDAGYESSYVTCGSTDGTATSSIGHAHLASSVSTSPDPEIYPPDSPATPLWSSVIVTFDDPKYSTPPAAL